MTTGFAVIGIIALGGAVIVAIALPRRRSRGTVSATERAQVATANRNYVSSLK